MIDTLAFYNHLVKNGFDFFCGVPDSLLKDLCACIKENAPKEKNIITANEGNAVAMCAGYHLSTGKYGVVYMQNSGLGNTVNPLLSLADREVYSIPMLLIIGLRGEVGVHDEPQHVKQGRVTMPLLEAMEIEYLILDENYEKQIDYCLEYLKRNSHPIALIVRKDSFSKYETKVDDNPFPLTREEALEAILSCLDDNDFIVSTTGKTSREIFELREKNKQGHGNDFLTVGSMGHTASIAYGLCMGTSNNVFCIDGDGSFIMHMGSLAVIGSSPLRNFKYIINVNGAHESVGGQPTCSFFLDIANVLKSFGFGKVHEAKSKEEIESAIKEMKDEGMSALVLYTRQGSRKDLGRPTTTPKENKSALMKKLGVK